MTAKEKSYRPADLFLNNYPIYGGLGGDTMLCTIFLQGNLFHDEFFYFNKIAGEL